MKTTFTLLLTVLVMIVFTSVSIAQYPEWNDPNSLPKWMTPEEELRRDEIGRGFVPTQPPLDPVRNIAEFNRMQGVLIRYPLGIPLSLVAAMSEHSIVYSIVESPTVQNQAINAYSGAGVNMDNCEFIIAPTNSYWTRDYGPWFVADGNNDVGIVDFPYNRPRPNDNAIPGVVANYLGITRYGMNVSHTGGNYMSDGMGISASTDLVWDENGNNQAYVLQQMQDFLGIHTYHVTIDPQGEYIKHIDCWAKFLDVDKILIAEVPPSNPRYWAYEQVANYYAEQISSYGTPFEVIRVYAPNGEPYTNSLILNNKVYVPVTGSGWDNTALSTYQQAMPGYEVLGFTGSWQSTDALHCRTKGIADLGTLYVKHIPLNGLHEYQPEFEIQADIIPYSGEALYSDSLFLIYKYHEGAFDTVPLFHTENNTYTGMLPVIPGNTEITYYLFAADESGRRENWPLVGASGARSFNVTIPPDIVVAPDSLVFDNYDQMLYGQPFFVNNPNDTIIVVDTIGMYGTGELAWFVEPASMTFPHTLNPGETLEMMVYIAIPVALNSGDYLTDSIVVQTNAYSHYVKVWLHEDMLSGADPIQLTERSLQAYPNPFNQQITFEFSLNAAHHVKLDVFDLRGRKVISLLDAMKTSGSHTVIWDGAGDNASLLPDGVYLVRMIAGNDVSTKKILLNP